jgi:hypothetical protein
MFFKKPQTKFLLVDGVLASNLEGVSEGYSIRDTGQGYFEILINVSAEHIEETYLGLCALVRQPAFGLVEVPTNEKEEVKLRQSSADPFHYDVYYYDGMVFENQRGMFKTFSHFLIHDGQITFGYGSAQGYDEVYVGRYKLFKIYADDPRKYGTYLQQHHYERREPMRTVFDNFSEASPGVTRSTTLNGKTIHDLVDVLTQKGFYFAERRPL